MKNGIVVEFPDMPPPKPIHSAEEAIAKINEMQQDDDCYFCTYNRVVKVVVVALLAVTAFLAAIGLWK